MNDYKTTLCRSLAFVSALALAGGVALAEKRDRGDRGPRDGDRPEHRQGDHDGKRQRAHQGEDGGHGEHDGRHHDGRHEDGEHGDRARRGGHHRLFADMDLNDDQKDRIHEVMRSHGDSRRAWHDEHKDEFRALRDKMRNAREADDKDAMQAAHDEIRGLMESAPKFDDAHDKVRAVLNEEQQATFDERVAKFHDRKDQWKDPHGDRPSDHRHGFGPDDDGPGHDGTPHHRREHARRLFGNLDLTDEQRDSIRDTMQGDGTRDEKMDAVRDLLTDEQKIQLDENLEEMRKWREEHKGERGEHSEHSRHHDDGRRHHPRRNDTGHDEQLDL